MKRKEEAKYFSHFISHILDYHVLPSMIAAIFKKEKKRRKHKCTFVSVH